jgi:sugar phosphate isomerase/epimerase
MDDWRGRYGPKRFFLENTRLSLFEAADAALESSRYGRPPLCADLGHLVMEGVDPRSWLESRLERVAEFHIHGYDGKSDHVAFSGDEAWFKNLDGVFRDFAGTVEIELFSWPDIEPALKALEPYLRSGR